MSEAARSTETANSERLPADLVELAAAIEQFPPENRRNIDRLLQKVIASTKRRRRILTLVQDALTQLRLDMKYLMFDLEATRRERDEYRAKIDEYEGRNAP